VVERVEVHIEGEPPPAPKGGGTPFALVVPGLGFIGLGVLVLVWPQILTIMVATMFMMIGVGLLFAARTLRRGYRRLSALDDLRRG
jgi:hypothetical protein